jgi:hypothetical protein
VIRWQEQPTNNTCGQTCVAMLLDIDVAIVRSALGSGPTSARTIAAYVNRRGFHVPATLVRWPPPLVHPRLMLVRLKKAETKIGHWVLVEHGVSYDPIWSRRRAWSWRVYGDWYQTGYLPISRKTVRNRRRARTD